MQDWGALLAEPGQDGADLRIRRVVSCRDAEGARQEAGLPGLLDTRLVRAELSRLRAPRATDTTAGSRSGRSLTVSAPDGRPRR
ncbi:MAG TPA: hypothetical protein VH061_13755 [Solirubrobacteraceae bacterium]|nr:hypothetical protein [Solirubrobacteraceae bacterium]